MLTSTAIARRHFAFFHYGTAFLQLLFLIVPLFGGRASAATALREFNLSGEYNAPSFLPDGERLATSGQLGITIWDLPSGRIASVLRAQANPVSSFAVSPNGQQIALGGGKDGSIEVWDLLTKQRRQILKGFGGYINLMSFSPTGTALAVAGNIMVEGKRHIYVRVLDLHDWSQTSVMTIESLGAGLDQFLVPSSSRRQHFIVWGLLLEFRQGTWDGTSITGSLEDFVLRNSELAGVLAQEMDQKDAMITSLAVSPNARFVAAAIGYREHNVKTWDLQTAKVIKEFDLGEDWLWSLAVSGEGKYIAGPQSKSREPRGPNDATGRLDNYILLWSDEEGKSVNKLFAHGTGVFKPTFSPDGKVLASWDFDSTGILWDAALGRVKGKIDGYTDAVAFHPNNQTFVTVDDGILKVWGREMMEVIRSLDDQKGHVSALAFSPDGSVLASGGIEGTIFLRDMKSLRTVGRIQTRDRIHWLRVLPGGLVLSSGYVEGLKQRVRIWSSASKKPVADLGEAFEGEVALSADGHILAIAQQEVVHLWNVRKKELSATIRWNGQKASAVEFSPNGRLLAIGGFHGAMQIWDVGARKLCATMPAEWESIASILFASDSKTMFVHVGSSLREIPIADHLGQACARSQ